MLVETLHAAWVVVGANFRFGSRAAGDVATLRTLGAERGFTAEGIPLDGGPMVWSSTYVRTCLAAGDVAGAAEALGHPYAVRGVVVRGDERGRELGYPTANVPTDQLTTAPADGVYAGWLRRLDTGETYPAAISVGTNPTFDGVRTRRVESYVLDRDDLDLYDVEVEVSFVERLRGMVAFDSVEELVRADGRSTWTAPARSWPPDVTGPAPSAVARRTAETWFLEHGLPYFVDEVRDTVRHRISRPRVVLVVVVAMLIGTAAGVLAGLLADRASAGVTSGLTVALLVVALYALRALQTAAIARWAAGRAFASLGLVVPLVTRALPMLLLFVTFFFINTEVWQVADALSLGVLCGLGAVLRRSPRSDSWSPGWARSSTTSMTWSTTRRS